MKLTHIQKTILSAISAFNELIDAGFIDGEKLPITSKGKNAIKGFTPDPVEFDMCLDYMFKPDETGGVKLNIDFAQQLGLIATH